MSPSLEGNQRLPWIPGSWAPQHVLEVGVQALLEHITSSMELELVLLKCGAKGRGPGSRSLRMAGTLNVSPQLHKPCICTFPPAIFLPVHVWPPIRGQWEPQGQGDTRGTEGPWQQQGPATGCSSSLAK